MNRSDAEVRNPADPLRTFLWFAGWADSTVSPLTEDASARRYFRVTQGSRSAVLMDASRIPESVPPFTRIAEHLRSLDFRAPRILARDPRRGWLLLEDFGDDTFARLLNEGANADELFSLGVDLLAKLHENPCAVPAGLRVYSPETMLDDLDLFLQWRTPKIPPSAADAFRTEWREILPRAHRVPRSLLLRDFHVANLMLLRNSEGLQRIGLLDFQDAYAGPVTYDLVSFLEDARRDLPDELRSRMMERYLARFPDLDRTAFFESAAIVAAQRHTRVLGIFERLSRKEQKHDYKRLHADRVRRLLNSALEHPALEGVKTWMNRHAAD